MEVEQTFPQLPSSTSSFFGRFQRVAVNWKSNAKRLATAIYQGPLFICVHFYMGSMCTRIQAIRQNSSKCGKIQSISTGKMKKCLEI